MLKKVLNATTVKNVKELISLIEEKYEIDWQPIGGKTSNHSTFQMLQDGEYGIIERLTNGIDAVIEKEYYLNPDPSIRSPRKSAEKYFNIVNGDLSSYATKDIDNDNRNLVLLKVLESGKINRPTIEVRDRGIGLTAEEFPNTILSLQGGNKLDKFYLAGTFGQGGSTANIFSEHTIYISKPILKKNSENKITFTITREFDDPEHIKTPIHQYMVDKKTGLPISIVDDENLFESGTAVRHVEMNVGNYGKSSAIAPGSNSLLFFINNTLFNPILPIKVLECRENVAKINIERNNNSRLIHGFNSSLNSNSNNKIVASNTVICKYTFGGEFKLNYWIIDSVDDYKNFNNRNTPLLFTINGQVQGTQGNKVLTSVGRPYLMDHIIINVDCDGIRDCWKTRLFTSDRVRFAHNDQSDALKEQVKSILESDNVLAQYNKLFHDRLLKESSDNMSEVLNRKIENKLDVYFSSGGIGKLTIVDKPITPHIPFVSTAIADFPTFIQITNQNPCEVEIGKNLSLNYQSDVDHNKYDLLSNLRFTASDEEKISDVVSRNFYRNGHGLYMFKFSTDVKVGDQLYLKIYVNGYEYDKNLSDTLLVKIIDRKPEKTTSDGESDKKSSPKINTICLTKEDPAYYTIFGDDESNVIDLKDNGDSIDIYINMEIRALNKLIENINTKEEDKNKITILKEEYTKQLAFYRLLLHFEQKKTSDELDEEKLNKECKRVAVLISGMINDNLSVYIKEIGDINESSRISE